jgi:hypothetical protein
MFVCSHLILLKAIKLLISDLIKLLPLFTAMNKLKSSFFYMLDIFYNLHNNINDQVFADGKQARTDSFG